MVMGVIRREGQMVERSATFRSHQRRQRVRLQMSMAFPIGHYGVSRNLVAVNCAEPPLTPPSLLGGERVPEGRVRGGSGYIFNLTTIGAA